MAIREFICRDCGHLYEEILRSYDAQQVPCPQCESSHTERLISAHGGYNMASGGSSTRPKQAGAFRNRRTK